MTHKVRTTMQPDKTLEVDDVEYLDLKQQGLLLEEDATEDVPPATAAPANPAKKSGPTGSKES
ncbi:hypothetical protein [Streptomyces sp. NPDC005799]|uniref:hypothetical protein n=1 Tax=Streptomyces sp. NPDC005799 TaxID=3154678 RepID=UPI00340B6361